jgi:predicted RecA/RadA family phage recombinase
MRYFLPGIIAGIFLSAAPFLMYKPAPALYAEWHADPASPQMTSPDPASTSGTDIVCGYNDRIVSFSPNGAITSTVIPSGETPFTDKPEKKAPSPVLFSLSGNGAFYTSYKKLGSEIEFFNLAGDRFWKIRSQEYPYLSYSGKLVLLLVADLSKIEILNNNGMKTGVGALTGRMCTVIAFSQKSDAAAAGFFDGTFYVLSERGDLLYKGNVPAESIVKSIAISDNAAFCAVHYGDGNRDGIMTVNIAKKKSWAFNLPHIHQTKTGVHITNDGIASIVNVTRFLIFTAKGKVIADIPLEKQKPGHAAIKEDRGLYLVTYRMESGGSALMVLDREGNPFFKKSFPAETALDCGFSGSTAWAKGVDSFYAWRVD